MRRNAGKVNAMASSLLSLSTLALDNSDVPLRRFQTELLGTVMDHLVAADVLIGDQAALPIASSGSSQNVAPNVFYLATRLVDKLWQVQR